MYVNKARRTWETLSANEFRNVITNYWGAEHDAAGLVGVQLLLLVQIISQMVLIAVTLITMTGRGRSSHYRISHNYNLSVGGAVGPVPYSISVNYTRNNGIVKGSSIGADCWY